MQILCDLTPIREHIASRGRSAGKTTKYKYVIGGDLWCWNVSKIAFKPDGTQYPPVSQSHYKGFEHLLLDLKEEYGVDYNTILSNIISALEERTGKKLTGIPLHTNTKELGRGIDSFFETNYLRSKHNNNSKIESRNIYFRVLKANVWETMKEGVEA